MKKNLLLLLVLSIGIFSCSKSKDNNTTTPTNASYEVDGVQDISLQNDQTEAINGTNTKSLAITLLHKSTSSITETVGLQLSGVPAGVTMTTISGGLSGTPTFQTAFLFSDTTVLGAVPGVYPITVTCTGSVTGTTTYTFNLTILAEPNYAANILGEYNNCFLSLAGPNGGSITYVDSTYVDPQYNNKLWFTNFANTKQKVYSIILRSTNGGTSIVIPTQIVNGYTFSEFSPGGIGNNNSIELHDLQVIYNGTIIFNGTTMTR